MEKKLPGFLQSIVDIPLALKGFPKNLFKEPSEDKEELDLYLREMSAYTWFGVLLVILGFILNINGVGMFVALAGFMFIILVLYRKNQAKNADLVEQIKEEAHSRSSSAQSYSSAPPAPQGPKPLSMLEKSELRSAQRHYDTCVRNHARAKVGNVSPGVVANCEAAEKEAFARLMAVQAKYAGRE